MKAQYQKLVILAKSEPKQSIALAVLLVIALGFWARSLAKSGSNAMASTGGSASQQVLEDQKSSALKPRPRVIVTGADPITRDLFVPRPEDFPPPVQTEPIDARASKSPTGSDDKTNKAQGLPRLTPEARVLAEAGELTLRSTVVGADPIAVIEHLREGKTQRTVLRVGDTVRGFRLVRVVDRRVVIEKDGIEVVLTLPIN